MTEQQQQHEDPSCAVDLSVSALPEDKKEVDQEEVFTTTIEASTTEVMPDVVKAEPQSGFDGFGFSEALLKTLAEKGYSDPSPIQKAAFPELMLGRDLVGQAQTGTGKTAAFALPLLERLESGRKTPQVLVLARQKRHGLKADLPQSNQLGDMVKSGVDQRRNQLDRLSHQDVLMELLESQA